MWRCPGLFSGWGGAPLTLQGAGRAGCLLRRHGDGAMLVLGCLPSTSHGSQSAPTSPRHVHHPWGDKASHQARGQGKIPRGRGWGDTVSIPPAVPARNGVALGMCPGVVACSWNRPGASSGGRRAGSGCALLLGETACGRHSRSTLGVCSSCFAETPSESVLGLSYSLGKRQSQRAPHVTATRNPPPWSLLGSLAAA